MILFHVPLQDMLRRVGSTVKHMSAPLPSRSGGHIVQIIMNGWRQELVLDMKEEQSKLKGRPVLPVSVDKIRCNNPATRHSDC